MTERRLSVGRRIAFGLAVPVVLFGLGEVAVRALDPTPPGALMAAPLAHAFDQHSSSAHYEQHPRLFWVLRPNLDEPYSRNGDVTDALGLRNRETPGQKGAATRVLCLGDSCTYGLGVPFDDAWPSILRASTDLDVVNAGVPGYSSHQGVVLLRERVADIDPDVVVVEFGINDVAPWPTPDGDSYAYLTDRERTAHLGFVARPWGSALIGWLAGPFVVPPPRRVPAAAPMELHTSMSPRVPPAEFEENIRTMTAAAPRAVLIAWVMRVRIAGLAQGITDPQALGNSTAARMVEYRGILRRIAEDEGHAFVDVEALLAESGLSAEALFVDDVHTSRAGAEIVAEAVRRACLAE